MEGKKPSDSAVESRYLVMPNQANPHRTAFGNANGNEVLVAQPGV
jgi:hypothetical protein